MSQSTPERTRSHDTLVVEASTAEEALAEVTALLGADAEIVAAEKVQRGGIGGFFAREMVQLTAKPRRQQHRLPPRRRAARDPMVAQPQDTDPTSARPESVSSPPAQPAVATGGLASVIDRLQAEAETDEASFSEALREQLDSLGPREPTDRDPTTNDETHAPPPSSAAPRSSHSRPAPASRPVGGSVAGRDLDTPSGTGGVRWSQDALARLGLPDVVVQATLGLEPDDDLAWLDALARGVSSLCRTLPKGHAVVAGPRAHRLGAALDLPVVRRPDPPPYGGSICLQTGDSRPGREWLAHVRGDRWLHVVAGSRGWRDLALDEPPLAISWVDHAALPEALQLCARLGLVLGYGTAGGRWDRVFRAAPVDVAIALRSLLPRS